MTYGFLTESIWHPPLAFAEGGDGELPSELELQALWYAGAFGRDFRTTDGRAVKIIQFGEWNRSSGPDFAHSAVEVDGRLATGPVELDPEPLSWEAHGHAEDPNFRDVILHVVFRADARRRFTRSLEHRDIPQVVIPDALLTEALNRPHREVAIAHPGRCVSPLRRMPNGSISRLLDEAAMHRAANKAGRFIRTAQAHGDDAALFQATAETLGYRGNALAMRLLAQRAPLNRIRNPNAEAILYGTAGFLSPELHEEAPEDTREYLRALWDTWWKIRTEFEVPPERAIPWKTHGQRPANHPHRRVAALNAITAAWPEYRRLALAAPFQSKPLIDFLATLKHPLWSGRHTLTSGPSSREIALFGRTQALELVANHLVPIALHQERMKYRDYCKLRSSSPNEKVKRCAIRLFGSLDKAAPWLRRLPHHQAMLQVYHDFCLEDFTDCADCPFPEQLSQWR